MSSLTLANALRLSLLCLLFATTAGTATTYQFGALLVDAPSQATANFPMDGAKGRLLITNAGTNKALSTTAPGAGVPPLNITTLWAWDNAQSKWYFYAPSLEVIGGPEGNTTNGADTDSIDSDSGTDTITYTISRSDFAVAKTSIGFTVTDNTGVNGIDTLQNVERLKFSDGGLALDLGATQFAGETSLLLGAVLPGRLVCDASTQALL